MPIWVKLVLENESYFVCILSPNYFQIFLPQPLKLWSAHLRWRKSLPPQLLHPLKKSPPQWRPLQSPSPLPLLPWCLLKKIRAPSCWRITSHTWDPSLVLTTGSSTPPEESLVWYSTDELARLLIYVHTTLLLIFAHSSSPLMVSQARSSFYSFHQIQNQMRSCTFAPFNCNNTITNQSGG